MGADGNIQTNLFLPLGKVRMGCPLGRFGWVALGEGQDGFEGSDGLSFGGRDGFGAEAEEAVVDGMASLGDI